MKWPMVPLKECARIVGGATPKSDVEDYWNGDIPWTTPKDISDLDGKFVSDTPRKITALGLRNCSSELLPPNSVLFSSRAPIGHVAINTVPMATNQGFKSMVPGPKLDASFLYWWLKCHRSQLEQLGNGATFKEVSKAIVERIEIPLPPLAEQKRIAAILDQADDLRRKRQRALDRLDQLGQAIFMEMFEADLRNPNSIPLRELVEEFRYGTSNKSSDNGYPTLRIPNVVGGTIDITDLKTVPLDNAEFKRLKLVDGDVLFVRTNGNPDYVGRSAVFTLAQLGITEAESSGWAYASYLIRARLKRQFLNPWFLQAYLSYPYGKKALRERSKTSAGQFNINTDGLGSIPIPNVPLTKQTLFSTALEQLQPFESQLSLASQHTEALFASLQHRAFRGEL